MRRMSEMVSAPGNKRRRMLMWSAPVLLIVLVLALKLLSLPVFAGQGASSFAANQGDGTIRAAHGMGTFNVVERYKAPFALGDGFALKGDFEQARVNFAKALDLAPPAESCKVRVNLVLSLEQLGDAKTKAGDPASARTYYDDGAAVVAAAPQGCFQPQGEGNQDGEGDKLKAASERLAQKQQQGEDPAQGDGQPGESQAPTEDQSPSQDKMDRLAKQGSDAQKERTQSQKLKDDYAEEAPEEYSKPW